MGSWFSMVWHKLRRLPIAQWIKPLWKEGLKDLVQREGDRFQERVKAEIAKHGLRAVDRNIDKWQADLTRGLALLPLPATAKDRVGILVAAHGDVLQERLKDAIKAGSAVDAAFDGAQAALLVAIDKL